MKEIWKEVPNFNGDYKVSSIGRVQSNKRKSWKIMKGNIRKDGYKQYSLWCDGKMRTYPLHQLVAMAFLNHNPSGMDLIVDHINNIKTDNRVENLQIITNRENSSKDQKERSSKYVGVFKSKYSWMSCIWISGKSVYLGSFKVEENASKTYEIALSIVHLFDGDATEFRLLVKNKTPLSQ